MAAITVRTPPVSASRPIAVEVTDASPFHKLGFQFLLVFLFLAFSRVFDVKFSSLHITGISYRVVFAMSILSGAFLVALNNKIGKAMLAFTFCFAISVPFSIWRGGSLPIFRDTWLTFSFVGFLATAGLSVTYEQTKKAINTLAWALFVFTIIVNIFGDTDSGRLFLSQGKFANPNEMAQALLIGLPLWIAKAGEDQAPMKKAFCGGVIILMLLTVFRTGSRGAMIAFAFMALFVFLRASVIGKAQLALGLIFMVGFVTVAMPGKIVARYKTIATDEVDDDEMDWGMRNSALTSTQSRKQLLKDSIKFTLRHPLVGVGPGMFPVADDEEMKNMGYRKGTWLGTHNSYTQVSSELGIPAFLFFSAAIFLATKWPYDLYRKTRDDPRTADIGALALGLHYAMLVYGVTVLFEHIAYTVMLPVFAGLSAALMRTATAEIDKRRSKPLVQPAGVPMFRTYSPFAREEVVR
jgi:hypothetical protein